MEIFEDNEIQARKISLEKKAYLEPCQMSMMEYLTAESTYFRKKFYHRQWPGPKCCKYATKYYFKTHFSHMLHLCTTQKRPKTYWANGLKILITSRKTLQQWYQISGSLLKCCWDMSGTTIFMILSERIILYKKL